MFCLPIIWVNGIVYSNEIFSPKWRYLPLGLYTLPIGYYVCTLIVYLSKDWSDIQLWSGIIVACTLPIYFLVPESPRQSIHFFMRFRQCSFLRDFNVSRE